MRICCYILLSAMLFSACRSSEKESKINDVESWIGKEIKFPAELFC